jgi:hypothetical protein
MTRKCGKRRKNGVMLYERREKLLTIDRNIKNIVTCQLSLPGGTNMAAKKKTAKKAAKKPAKKPAKKKAAKKKK